MVHQEHMPRRPGFTAGVEESVWQGSPSLVSTSYYWFVSILGAWFVYLMLTKGAEGLSQIGFFGQGPGSLRASLFPNGELVWWVAILPWVIFLAPAAWYTLNVSVTTYQLTTQRLVIRSGILVRMHDQIELFRVRDFLVDTPLHMGLLGLAHVRIVSRDETLPVVTLLAQPRAVELVDTIRDCVQHRKDEVGMREFETNNYAM